MRTAGSGTSKVPERTIYQVSRGVCDGPQINILVKEGKAGAERHLNNM
jgi:hypothetical protein